jgi:hypothetical protein
VSLKNLLSHYPALAGAIVLGFTLFIRLADLLNGFFKVATS